jgi:hypothetical protein
MTDLPCEFGSPSTNSMEMLPHIIVGIAKFTIIRLEVLAHFYFVDKYHTLVDILLSVHKFHANKIQISNDATSYEIPHGIHCETHELSPWLREIGILGRFYP